MDCAVAREALSARLDGEREPIPAARVDEHLTECVDCRRWYAAAVEQTQQLRRLAGRSQVAAVPPARERGWRGSTRRSDWPRWALALVGTAQLALAVAQGLGIQVGLPHAGHGGHLLNESTAWSAALGAVMIASAIRPSVATGLAWVLAAYAAILAVYVISDATAGAVTADRVLSHLPVVLGAVLAVLVWRRRPPQPESGPHALDAEITLPGRAVRGRRRGHLHPTDGSAA
ncbi:MAG: hypothetical protein EBU23_09040 [Mycobacteriaceae bacterium]|nr:hypothetical protein [Mycobacteriaceae bacterium]